jgi:hypothetical protein
LIQRNWKKIDLCSGLSLYEFHIIKIQNTKEYGDVSIT